MALYSYSPWYQAKMAGIWNDQPQMTFMDALYWLTSQFDCTVAGFLDRPRGILEQKVVTSTPNDFQFYAFYI